MTAKEFILALPEQVKPEMLEGVDTLFHFDIAGENGGQFTVEVKDNCISATEGLTGEAKCAIKAKDTNLIGVVTGSLNPMMAVLTGKIKISNQAEMIKYAKMFGMM